MIPMVHRCIVCLMAGSKGIEVGYSRLFLKNFSYSSSFKDSETEHDDDYQGRYGSADQC